MLAYSQDGSGVDMNTWELFLVSAPEPECAPFSNNNVTMSFRVTGDSCGTICGVLYPFGEACADDITPLIAEMIGYFSGSNTYGVILQPTDIVYVNGVLYQGPNLWFIQYNMSMMPTDFLNWISGTITTISNVLGGYISPYLTNGVIYDHAEFDGANLKIYVNVHTSSGVSVTVLDMDTNESLGVDIPQVLLNIAIAIFGVIIAILLIIAMLTVGTTLMGVLLVVAGLALAGFGIYQAVQGIFYPVEPNTVKDRINNVDDYVSNYLGPDCDNEFPGCSSGTVTCNASQMASYLACTDNMYIAQCMYNKAQVGAAYNQDCDALATAHENIITALNGGTMTPQQARDTSLEDIVNPTKAAVDQAKTITNCPGGYWDTKTQSCQENCWISNPAGGCILSARTGKLFLIGGGVLALYFGYRYLSKEPTVQKYLGYPAPSMPTKTPIKTPAKMPAKTFRTAQGIDIIV